VVEKERASCGGLRSNERVDTKVLMSFYVEGNTSQGKNWIFDFGSTIHVCSQKEMFNSLVSKEEEIVKMVNHSAYKIIGTGTVKLIKRDGMMHALEVV